MKILEHAVIKTNTPQLRWLWLSLLVIGLDQFTKSLVTHHLMLHQPLYLLPFFNLMFALNAGAAFSFLGEASGWQRWFFVSVALVISGFILRWLMQLPRTQNWNASAFALILGGALGNVYDRIAYGYVIDFFDFHINTWHFPTFNVADSAICVGVGMWILSTLRKTDVSAE